jgi:hypothetical protein
MRLFFSSRRVVHERVVCGWHSIGILLIRQVETISRVLESIADGQSALPSRFSMLPEKKM